MPQITPLCERALRFSATAHRDQQRKGSDIPYIIHPCAVAMLLQQAGITDENVLAAAILHDTVEDTPVTAQDLADAFPPEVCTIVADLTEEKVDAAGEECPWEIRKQDHIDHVARMSDDSRCVLLADKLHNLTAIAYDMKHSPDGLESVWNRFARPKDKVLWYHTAILDAIGDSSHAVVNALSDSCRRVLAEISED